ncbi:MAG: glycosyltransferase family 2 protein [Sarcina sp.]
MIEIIIALISIVLIIIYIKFGQVQHLENQKIRNSNIKYKGFSILIPCHNNANELKDLVSHLKKIKYPNFEVIFINDGSTDHSMQKLTYLLELEQEQTKQCNNIVKGIYKSKNSQGMYVIDKLYGGRIQSLSCGLEISNKEFVVTTTATAILKKDALFFANMNLQDENVIAMSGAVIVRDGIDLECEEGLVLQSNCKLIEYAQFMECITIFYIIKNSLIKTNSISILSSSFGITNKSVMKKIGLFEDLNNTSMDLSVLLKKYAKKHNKKITYDDRAICFERVKDNVFSCCLLKIKEQCSFLKVLRVNIKLLVNGSLKKLLFIGAFFNVIFLGYLSIILTIIGIFYLILSVITHSKIGMNIYILMILGIIIFLIYSTINMKIALKNNVNFKNIKKHKIILIYLYILIVYKPLIIVTYMYVFIKSCTGDKCICSYLRKKIRALIHK